MEIVGRITYESTTLAEFYLDDLYDPPNINQDFVPSSTNSENTHSEDNGNNDFTNNEEEGSLDNKELETEELKVENNNDKNTNPFMKFYKRLTKHFLMGSGSNKNDIPVTNNQESINNEECEFLQGFNLVSDDDNDEDNNSEEILNAQSHLRSFQTTLRRRLMLSRRASEAKKSHRLSTLFSRRRRQVEEDDDEKIEDEQILDNNMEDKEYEEGMEKAQINFDDDVIPMESFNPETKDSEFSLAHDRRFISQRMFSLNDLFRSSIRIKKDSEEKIRELEKSRIFNSPLLFSFQMGHNNTVSTGSQSEIMSFEEDNRSEDLFNVTPRYERARRSNNNLLQRSGLPTGLFRYHTDGHDSQRLVELRRIFN